MTALASPHLSSHPPSARALVGPASAIADPEALSPDVRRLLDVLARIELRRRARLHRGLARISLGEVVRS
jgi:hypothetical protein